jgi:hypothetical protein
MIDTVFGLASVRNEAEESLRRLVCVIVQKAWSPVRHCCGGRLSEGGASEDAWWHLELLHDSRERRPVCGCFVAHSEVSERFPEQL